MAGLSVGNYGAFQTPTGVGTGLPPGFNTSQRQWSIPEGSAPPGYVWDMVQGAYVPDVGSASNASMLQGRQLGWEDVTHGQEQEAFKALQGMMSQPLGGYTPAPLPASASPANPTGSGVPPELHYINPDESGAQAAIFGRAKDQVGQTSQAAIRALKGQLAGRGMLGSGQESRGTRELIGQGAAQLGDISRENAIQSLNQVQKANELNFSGGIQQRSQNIGAAQATADRANQFNLAQQGYGLQARGQDIAAQGQRVSQAQGFLNALRSLY